MVAAGLLLPLAWLSLRTTVDVDGRVVRDLLTTVVVKARPEREPERFELVSPVHRISDAAPPFFVINGSADTLIDPAESRGFVKRLRAVSREPVLHAELRGGQHGLDIIPSWRSAPVFEAVERFLAAVHAAHRGRAGAVEDTVREELTG